MMKIAQGLKKFLEEFKRGETCLARTYAGGERFFARTFAECKEEI